MVQGECGWGLHDSREHSMERRDAMDARPSMVAESPAVCGELLRRNDDNGTQSTRGGYETRKESNRVRSRCLPA
jgi:hypothetical protein